MYGEVIEHSLSESEKADSSRQERLCFAARVLLDSVGRQVPVTSAEAAVDEWRQVLLREDVPIEENELLQIFASVSLQRELATQQTDQIGRFLESAIAWDVSRPWVDLRARDFGQPQMRRGTETGFPFSVLITHDVDRTTTQEPFSVLNSLRYALRPRHKQWWSLATALSSRSLIGTIERLLAFERANRIGAHYFMMAGPYGLGRYSPRTDVRWFSARKVARLVQSAGMAIGLHGSFSARERNSYGEEKDRLEQTLGCVVRTHRNHYLRFDPARLYSQLEQAAIQFDLSVGFVNRIGFRAASARSHRAFDMVQGRLSSVLSVPQLFMDTVMQHRSPAEILVELREALSHVRAVQGCVCLVFHPETFLIDSRAWPLFQAVIQICQDMGADLSGTLPSFTRPLGCSHRG